MGMVGNGIIITDVSVPRTPTQAIASIIDLIERWLANRTEALKKPETMAMDTAMMV